MVDRDLEPKCGGCGVGLLSGVEFHTFSEGPPLCSACVRVWARTENVEIGVNATGQFELIVRQIHPDVKTIRSWTVLSTNVILTRDELERIVLKGSELFGWVAGPDMNLNPSNLPTRAKLVESVEAATNTHPVVKSVPSFARFIRAIEVLRVYCTWLPSEHRAGVDRDLAFIERRLEELLMFRRFLREFLNKFSNQPAAPVSAHAMFSTVMRFVEMLKETTGIDLTGKDEGMW